MVTKISWLQDFYGWEKLEESYFSIDDWINVNGDIQLIRIDPLVAAKNLFIASNIKFLGDFRLYQCDSPSLIRDKVPLRFFYNKIHGKVYELKGDNKPFYDIMTFITLIEDYERVTRLDSSWFNLKNIFSYAKMFFDNVTGRHGRFEIVEDYESDLLNRVKTYEIYSGEKIHEPFTSAQIDYQRRIYSFFDKNKIQWKKEEMKRDELSIKNVCMVFKNALFQATIVFKLDKENFGQIGLTDEIQLDYHFFLKQAFSDEQDIKQYENIKTLANIGASYFKNHH